MNNKLVFTISGIIVLTGMLAAPSECIANAYDSLRLCSTAIIPTLLPFFICVRILTKSGFSRLIGKHLGFIMRPLFNLPGEGAFALVMGFLSGYPMGAKCAVQMLEDKICTKSEAQRIICFCNNSGPLFVIGSVGTVMLANKNAGLILYISHILSALTIGLISGFKKVPEKHVIKQTADTDEGGILSSAVSESVNLILYVCGYIIFFNVLVTALDILGILKIMCFPLTFLGIDYNLGKGLQCSIIEITKGISILSAQSLGIYKLPVISFFLGWSGLSIILQIIGVTEKHKFNSGKLILAKLAQGIISFFYTFIFINLPFTVTVSNFKAPAFTFAGNLVCGILLVFLSIAILCTASIVLGFIKFIVYKKF